MPAVVASHMVAQARPTFGQSPRLPASQTATAIFPHEDIDGDDLSSPSPETVPVLPLEVGIHYTYPEQSGTAEVTYILPAGQTYLLDDYQEILNDDLKPGMRIRLKEGSVAGIADVRLFYDPPDPPVRRPDGQYLSRVVGTIRHAGPITVDVTWPGWTATSSPDHPYYSVSRGGYVPAGELQIGELLLNDQDRVVPVLAVGGTKLGMTELYNIEVEQFHNYYVGQPGGRAVLVHNSASPGQYINTPAQVAKEVGEYPIPKGGISIESRIASLPEVNAQRARSGQRPMKIDPRAEKNPSEWYYDSASAGYKQRPAPAVDISAAGVTREIPCFPAGVEVATPEGRTPIEQVRIGMEVHAYDESTGEVVTRCVTQVLRGKTKQLVNVSINGEIIPATRNHRFWEGSRRKWTAARDLKAGMVARQVDSRSEQISSIDVRQVPLQSTFNLTVDGCHNYYVGNLGVLVHNAGEATHSVYFGYAPTDATMANPIYVGRAENVLRRQGQHRLEATAEPQKYGFKTDIRLRTQIDGLTLDQAVYHEAALYHKMAENGHVWSNLQEPLTKEKVNALAARYC